MFIFIASKKNKLQTIKSPLIIFSFLLLLQLLFSCKSTKLEEVTSENLAEENIQVEEIVEEEIIIEEKIISNEINLMFAGDIMAHTPNYIISEYAKIYRDVKDIIEPADLAFANIEAPIDTKKPASSYPNFNMTKKYVCAAVNAGFDVFSLCNNHTNDQGLEGILETIKTTEEITQEYAQMDIPLYFSGTKESSEAEFTYNLIEKNGWKILFLPMTELLNRPQHSSYINFVKTDDKSRKEFAAYVKELREKNPCDLFVLSVHTSEPEYTRVITEKQRNYYLELLDAGADIIMANHAHIVKDREFVYNSKDGSQKLIMYANGNVISAQRTKPNFDSKNPDFERDNTGDGLFFYVTYRKDPDNPQEPPQIVASHKQFITTYINTANEYVIKKLDEDFVKYLYDVPRNHWAEYIKRRIKIDNTSTKDLITWQ
ncbi:MAG: CapA family protein [Treponema sp.]|nr:CapA family protein [Treponema sp.]